MRIFWVLLRRELASFFFSLTGYVIIAAVALLTGLSFVVLTLTLGSDPVTVPVTEAVLLALPTPASDVSAAAGAAEAAAAC